MRKAILLINLGTPRSPSVADVRAYLKEFLMDPWVIDIPFILRWMLVHWIILPRRPQLSSKAYEKIWTKEGSPLLVYSEKLKNELQIHLSEKRPELGLEVFLAMRYGQPSLESVLKEIQAQGFSELLLFPLYPQYSLAATESSLRECRRVIQKLKWPVKVQEVTSFYQSQVFIDGFAQQIQENTKDFHYDHLLMSFHGLPERQVKKTDSTGQHCLASPTCCEKMVSANQNCYRAQCFETARQIAKKLGLSEKDYTVCFQSRLGRTPWIKPYTDELYASLPKTGIRRLAVACPSFVADCLETLEEVQIRGRKQWLESRGEELLLVSDTFCMLGALFEIELL